MKKTSSNNFSKPAHYRNGANKQKGQSLIEFVLYLALAVLIIAGIIYFTARGNDSRNVQTESENISFVVSSARTLYNGSATGFENVTAANLINNGSVPATEVTNTTITSSFGTPVTVASGTLYNANDALVLTYLVPPEICSSFVSSVQPTFAKITVAGTTVKNTTVGTSFTQSSLGTACSASSGASVTVVLYASR